jgi:arsenate reductase
MAKRFKILFLCTGNSCRSQMAEGWARALKGDVIEAYSAGIETHGLNPLAVRVMAEAGVDISGQKSKTVDAVKDVPFDYVVTVCGHAHETCPMWLGGKAKVIHVGFDDPPALAKTAQTEEEALGHYRRVRDEIRTFVERLPDGLTQTALSCLSAAKPFHSLRCLRHSSSAAMGRMWCSRIGSRPFSVRGRNRSAS